MTINTTPEALNHALISMLRRRGDLQDAAVEAAFLAVPRHHFLPGVPLSRAYADESVAVKRDNDGTILSSLSQPGMIATMLRQLRLSEGDNVLEIGTGTGYTAALIQNMIGDTGKLATIELDQDVAKQATANLQRIGMASKITIVRGDGAMGYAPRASYDRIIAAVGVWDVPETWKQQLKPGGVLVTPIWLDALQASAAFHLQPDGSLYSSDNQPCGCIFLRGVAAGPRVSARVGSSSLVLVYSPENRLDMTAFKWLLSDDAETGYLDIDLTAESYWNGFLPYLMLNLPDDFVLALYHLIDDTAAYGMTEPGFALIGPGSACFIPYHGQGKVFTFAGADAFLAVEDSLTRWNDTGRIDSSRLRLQLTPKQATGAPVAVNSKAYPRRDHTLHVWFD